MQLDANTWFDSSYVWGFVQTLARCWWWFANNYSYIFECRQTLGIYIGVLKLEGKSLQILRREEDHSLFTFPLHLTFTFNS